MLSTGDNIKIDLGETVCGGLDWIQEPVAGFCEDCNEPLGSIEGGEFVDKLNVTISFYRRPLLQAFSLRNKYTKYNILI